MSYDDSSMNFKASRKSLSGGFRNTSDYLAKNHEQLSAASNIEISAEDRKESFKNTETHIYSFFGVSVKLMYNLWHFRFHTNSYTNAC